MRTTISIVGGGISGIIAAIELEKAGFAPSIYEANDSLGGRVRSEIIDGYAYDHGFQVLLTAYPEAQRYLNYDQLDLQYFLSGSRVSYGDKTVRIGDPLSSSTFWLDALDPTLSMLTDKIKTLRLSLKLKKKELLKIFDEPEVSTYTYLRKQGFSERVIERFYKPFFGGIFLDPELMTSSRLFEYLFKMFGKGYSVIPKGGMQKITDQLVGKLSKTQIHLSSRVSQVESQKIKLQDGSETKCDHIIIATDASKILNTVNPTKWKKSINFYFELDNADYREKIITLSAQPDRYVNNYYYPTNLMSHPHGKTILSATVIDDRGKNEEELVDIVKNELKAMGVKGTLRLVTTYDIPYSLPDIEHVSHTLTPEKIELMSGVYTCGDHLLMGSLNAAMYSGRYVAEFIINHRNN